MKKSNTKEFIKKATKIHLNLYCYKYVNYINSHTNIKIKCKEHGIFLQQPGIHIFGQGCPSCNSSKGELKIKKHLQESKIKFEQQKIFSGCKNKRVLPFDFYLPNINTCIEYDGQQHFNQICYFGGQKSFNEIKKNDKIKTKYCQENNIILKRISFREFKNIEKILISII